MNRFLMRNSSWLLGSKIQHSLYFDAIKFLRLFYFGCFNIDSCDSLYFPFLILVV